MGTLGVVGPKHLGARNKQTNKHTNHEMIRSSKVWEGLTGQVCKLSRSDSNKRRGRLRFSADQRIIYVVALLLPSVGSMFEVNSVLAIDPAQSIIRCSRQTFYIYALEYLEPGRSETKLKCNRSLPTETPTIINLLESLWLAGMHFSLLAPASGPYRKQLATSQFCVVRGG